MKHLLSRALSHTAPVLPFKYWQGLWGGKLFLPFYHLVSDAPPPHLRHLYPVRSEKQFRADLDFLLQHFQPIDLQTLWGHIFENYPFTRPVFHLTFDDGLRECHDVVMPILLEKGIPATFFLNTDFVDNRALMFRYKASLLRHTGRILPSDPMQITYANQYLLDTWAVDIGLDFSAYLEEQKPYLDRVQIRAMQNQGFTFGAHSIDHPRYSQIPLEAQIRQTLESLFAVKELCGSELPTFAFPFTDHGVGVDFFNILREKMDGPVLTFGTAGAKQDTFPTHLHRFAMEHSALPVQKMLSAELAYAVLRKILGKNTVERPSTNPSATP